MVQMRWVGSVKYHQGRAGSNWHGGRISFGTRSASKRSSRPTSYSKRPRCARATRKLLELLTRFQSTGTAEYTIEDFAPRWMPPRSSRELRQGANQDHRTRRKELQEKDGWLIQWLPIKAGRKVKAVRFTFMRDPQGRLL
jgi:hypothetical protein